MPVFLRIFVFKNYQKSGLNQNLLELNIHLNFQVFMTI